MEGGVLSESQYGTQSKGVDGVWGGGLGSLSMLSHLISRDDRSALLMRCCWVCYAGRQYVCMLIMLSCYASGWLMAGR